MNCDLGDLSIYYETYGAGQPIVMLPGRPSDHRIMLRFMEPLFAQRDGWLRIYPDLPGTGRTPSVDHLSTHDQMLDTVLAFIDTIIPGQRFVLAGLSYGGYLARGVVYHKEALIDGLMLCAPQVKGDPSQAHLPAKTTLLEGPKLAAKLGPISDLVVVQSPKVMESMHDVLSEVRIADHPFNDRLEAAAPFSVDVDKLPAPFERPALIMTGRQDNLCGYRDAWELLDNYPRATFAVLDGAGHFINIEQDGLCRALMSEWLERVEESAM